MNKKQKKERAKKRNEERAGVQFFYDWAPVEFSRPLDLGITPEMFLSAIKRWEKKWAWRQRAPRDIEKVREYDADKRNLEKCTRSIYRWEILEGKERPVGVNMEMFTFLEERGYGFYIDLVGNVRLVKFTKDKHCALPTEWGFSVPFFYDSFHAEEELQKAIYRADDRRRAAMSEDGKH